MCPKSFCLPLHQTFPLTLYPEPFFTHRFFPLSFILNLSLLFTQTIPLILYPEPFITFTQIFPLILLNPKLYSTLLSFSFTYAWYRVKYKQRFWVNNKERVGVKNKKRFWLKDKEKFRVMGMDRSRVKGTERFGVNDKGKGLSSKGYGMV